VDGHSPRIRRKPCSLLSRLSITSSADDIRWLGLYFASARQAAISTLPGPSIFRCRTWITLSPEPTRTGTPIAPLENNPSVLSVPDAAVEALELHLEPRSFLCSVQLTGEPAHVLLSVRLQLFSFSLKRFSIVASSSVRKAEVPTLGFPDFEVSEMN